MIRRENDRKIQYVNEYLYVWRKPTSSQNVYVIGMEKSPGSRDGEYLNKINSEITHKNKIFSGQLTTEYPTDHKIHNYLKNDCSDFVRWDGPVGKGLLKNTREAFTITKGHDEKELLSTLSMLLTQHPDSYMRVNDFKLRDYQEKLKQRCIDILSKNEECCLQLSTRGGKSFLTLKIAQEYGAKNILILTPMPMAKTSFIDVAQKHKDFTGWKFTDGVNLDAQTKFADDYNICLVSFQLFDEEKQKIANMLQKVGFDFIIVDEAHNTSDSARSQEILELFKDAKKLYTSGTFYNDIYSNRFPPEVMVNYDFIDLIKYDNKTHEVGFPKLVINNVCNMDEIKAELEKKAQEKGEEAVQHIRNIDDFNFKTIFSTTTNIKSFFDWALPKIQGDFIAEPSWYQEVDEEENHILMFVPSLKSTNNLKKVIENYTKDPNSILFGYRYDFISGLTESDNDIQDKSKNIEDKYNRIMDENKKTLFISVDKMTTGVTLKKLDTIFMMRNISSAEKFVQILFRTMTPYANKKFAKLYNFNSDTTLKVVKNFIGTCNIVKKQDDTEALKDFFKCIDVKVINHQKALSSQYEFESVSVEDYLAKVKEIPLDYNQSDVFDLDITNSVLDKYKDILESLDIKVEKSGAFIIAGKEQKTSEIKEVSRKKEWTYSDKKEKEEDSRKEKEQKKKEKELYEKVMQILRHLDYEILCNNVMKFDDLLGIEITNRDGTPFCEEYDIEIQSLLKEIFKANHVSVSNFINDINRNFRERPVETVYHLSRFDDTDRATPLDLIGKMFDKFSKEKKEILLDGKGTIADICCGQGAMLLYLRDVVGISADKIYGIDKHPKNVNLCHRLGFKNVITGDAKTDLDKLKEMIVNTTNTTNTKSNSNNNGTVDCIIMNPPYDGNLHLQILDKVIKTFPDAEIVNLSPIRWLQDPLAEYKKASDFKRFPKIRERIESLEVMDATTASRWFNAGLAVDLGVYYITKNGEGVDLRNKIAMKIYEKGAHFDEFEADKKDGWRVKFSLIGGNLRRDRKGILSLLPKLLYFYDGMKDGRPWHEFYGKNKHSKYTEMIPYSIKFASEKEAHNFIETTRTTKIGRYYFGIMMQDTGIYPEYFLKLDYTKKWDDAAQREYFELTDEEWKEIEGTVKE